jgi:tetratricopeptide (TPR) repeat protein
LDLGDSKGAIIEPKGPVEQQFGNRYYNINIPKAEELSRLPTIPEPPSDFTGRNEELQELQAKFAGGTNIIGLRGIGGVGKTALALKLAESLKDGYPDGQIMVDMRGTSDNPTSPSEAMGSVIHAFHPSEKLPDNEAEVKEMYLRLLAGKRALLLLDNALDGKQALNLIPPKSCGLLVTSRKTIKLPGLFRKDLDVLKPEEALELLLKVCCSTSDSGEPRGTDQAWSDIARLCGFLPLALRAAGSYLANAEDVSPTHYAEKLKDERTRLERIGEEGVELGVDASFNLSFQKLKPVTQQTFLNLSVFPADFDGQAEEQICQDGGHERLSELLRWSLVDYKPLGKDYGRYKLHDLARLFALARQPDESKSIVHEHHAAYYKELLSASNSLYIKGGSRILVGLALFDREQMNINAGQAWADKNLEIISSAANLCVSYPDAGVYILDLRLHPREKIAWLERGIEAARRSKDKTQEGFHLGNLGNAYVDLGETRKAIKYYDQALKILREIGDRRGEGANLGNLGIAYANLSETRKAIKYYDQALKILREIGDRRDEGNHLGNLGRAYSHLGETRKAIEYYDQALKISREIGDRRGEGANLGNLGSAYANLGETRKAIKYYEQALKISREIGDQRGEGNRLGYLGNAYANFGEMRKAIEHYEQALKISREIGDRLGEESHLGNLGSAYVNLGETRKAIEYYDQALTIDCKIGDRQGEGVDLGNLGSAYANLGEMRKAIDYYDQALKISREIGDRRGEGNRLGNLGSAYANLGETRKATDYYDQALKISRGIGDRRGEESHLGNLGLAYADLGDAWKAIDYYKQALAISREIGDKRNEGAWLGNLGSAYYRLGDAQKAIEYHEHALAIAREVGDKRGEGNELGNLGSAYYRLGDARKAIKYHEQALAIAREIGDRRNEGVWLGNLGNAYAALGDARKAIEYYEQRLAIAREIGDLRGEGNALWNMSLALYNLDKPSDAIKKAESALQIYEQIECPMTARVKQQLAEWRK